ncbi:TPA: hypothetical protein NR963_004194 [Pseudomonas aeruginosa]|nr:hypothetical protein Q061_01968 [Pseudomonas aeruginosa BL07]HCH7474264.1 hypothetical protein [Pseudomonas aeruginosa]HCH7803330.1 hypothetical protein [Pseudomonas aeruginosa]HCI4167809.1 hypothetical protein [Pseudomonas aeruginosa]HCI7162569.1 hypothetical protein [Pseudomonas aeruginosa]
MPKTHLQQSDKSVKVERAGVPVVTPQARQVHKEDEVNISAYFPADVKSCLRMVQSRNGKNVKDCLAEALLDLFIKHDVPVPLSMKMGGDH